MDMRQLMEQDTRRAEAAQARPRQDGVPVSEDEVAALYARLHQHASWLPLRRGLGRGLQVFVMGAVALVGIALLDRGSVGFALLAAALAGLVAGALSALPTMQWPEPLHLYRGTFVRGEELDNGRRGSIKTLFMVVDSVWSLDEEACAPLDDLRDRVDGEPEGFGCELTEVWAGLEPGAPVDVVCRGDAVVVAVRDGDVWREG